MLDIHIFLAILLGVTNIFWVFVTMKLLNRLMSRNYTEFVAAEKLSKPKKPQLSPLHIPGPDPYHEQKAKDLNQLMGMT